MTESASIIKQSLTFQSYYRALMISYKGQIAWKQPLTNITKYNHSVVGLNLYHELVEVDTRDGSTDKIFSHPPSTMDDIVGCRYLRTQFDKAYYFSFRGKIETSKGHIICETNSKAEFGRCLDGYQDTLIFSKYHKNHQKHSINLLTPGAEKKIVKLADNPITNLHVGRQSSINHILFDVESQGMGLLDIDKSDIESTFPMDRSFTFDENYVYIMKAPLGDASKRSGKYSASSMYNVDQNKVRVSAVEGKDLRKYRKESSCSLEFNLSSYPLRMQNFVYDLYVGFEHGFELYDIRKLAVPYFHKDTNGYMYDFYLDANLMKFYVSLKQGLQIYELR